jgi:hypothetical protein
VRAITESVYYFYRKLMGLFCLFEEILNDRNYSGIKFCVDELLKLSKRD